LFVILLADEIDSAHPHHDVSPGVKLQVDINRLSQLVAPVFKHYSDFQWAQSSDHCDPPVSLESTGWNSMAHQAQCSRLKSTNESRSSLKAKSQFDPTRIQPLAPPFETNLLAFTRRSRSTTSINRQCRT
jgi:hypothetical protein